MSEEWRYLSRTRTVWLAERLAIKVTYMIAYKDFLSRPTTGCSGAVRSRWTNLRRCSRQAR